jgi:aryl-alcohol dehydrogenase-like predicted oxidoreductase
VLPYCIKNKIGVVVYSPLQRGLLTGKIKADRKFPNTDDRSADAFFKPENLKRVHEFLGKIRPIADAHKATLAQMVINWTIQRPGITAALVGARNPKQVEENAGTANFKLTKEEIKQIDKLLEDLKLEV